MNRLIIVGNGFDLAHGLPTSYKHFMDNFWERLRFNYKKESIKRMVLIDEKYDGIFTFNSEPIKCNKDLKENMIGYAKAYNLRFNENNNMLYKNSIEGIYIDLIMNLRILNLL